jgi:CheY-like chemotaxis protein
MFKLLVVEDDLENRELLGELLQDLKTDVYATQTSEEAAQLVHNQTFDGIFLDLTMPVLDGFELAKIVRDSNINRATPIIVVTGREEQETMHQAFSVGATYFLQKPITRESLVSILSKLAEPKYENRRRFARAPLNTGVTCTFENQSLHGVTWNISQGGIQLEVAGLQKGDNLEMSFILPDPATIIKAKGVVSWIQEERQGLYFTGMNLEAQERIRQFVLGAGYR